MRTLGVVQPQRKTHITDVEEVRYRFHRWYGQQVFVGGTSVRSGELMLRCRRADERGFPVLEIPQWMFNAHVSATMELHHSVVACCTALRNLKILLGDAEKASWFPGGVHAEAVEKEECAARSISDIAPESNVAQGSEPEGYDPAGANVPRARREIPAHRKGSRS